MEFDHVTNRYLYPDRYIKMILYFLINQTKLYAFILSLYNKYLNILNMETM
jgi:hypothetical protein